MGRSFKAKFSSICPVCSQPIAVEMPVQWAFGNGKKRVVHESCSTDNALVTLKKPAWIPNGEQQPIIDYVLRMIADQQQFTVLIKAGPGAGKTATLEYIGASVVELWEHQQLTFKRPPLKYMAFDNEITNELMRRMTHPWLDISTFHRFGLDLIKQAWQIQWREKPDDKLFFLYLDAICPEFNRLKDEQQEQRLKEFRKMKALISMAKAHLYKPENLLKQLDGLAEKYDISLPDADRHGDFYTRLHKLFRLSIEQRQTVDFDDMLYFPYYYELEFPQYVMVAGDEWQDQNPIRQWYAKQLHAQGASVIAVGDEDQAIYGFTGADCESMNTFQRDMAAMVFPLYTCRRIENLYIIEEAATIANKIKPRDDARYGDPIDILTLQAMYRQVTEGDAILSRTNAPLIEMYFELLRRRMPVVIRGRNIGEGIVELMLELADGSQNLAQVQKRLHEWEAVQMQKAKKNEMVIAAINDKVQSLAVVCDCFETVQDAMEGVQRMFSDNGNAGQRVILSSTHKAKGLEWNRVYLAKWVDGKLMYPHPKVKQEEFVQQEMNLLFVGITRAKQRLNYFNFEN